MKPERIFLALTLSTVMRAAEPAPAVATLTYSGDQSAAVALDRELADAGSDAAKLSALEARLLAALRRTDTTFAARQALCQRLGLVLALGPKKSAADAYKPLGAMLVDDRDSDLARLALEPAPGEAIDGLFVAALAKARGRTRLGLIDSIGRRRIDSAVTILTGLLRDSDAATAGAAARALGEIASPAAVAALFATPEPTAPDVAAAKLAAAPRLPASAAIPMLREMETKAARPAHRVAALRLGLEIGTGSDATARLLSILGGKDWTAKQAALQAIAPAATENLVPALTAKLATWDPSTQAAVIAALGRRGDAQATPAVIIATQHADRHVRAAALSALGALPGSRATTDVLVKTIQKGETEDARLARQSLARSKGAEVDAAIQAGTKTGEAASRVVYLEQIALRNQTDAIPLLLAARQDSDATIRSAAVGALGEIALPSQEDALLKWTVEATDEAEQSRALRALVNVTLRHPAPDDRGRAVFEAIRNSPSPIALRLLPALARIGNDAAIAAAKRLALGAEAALAEAATEVLVRWPDATALSKPRWQERTALGALISVARDGAIPAVRKSAFDATLEHFENHREGWSPSASETVMALFATTPAAPTRKRLVALLSRASDRKSLQFVENLRGDPDNGSAARTAAEIIAANLAGPPTVRASAPANLKNLLDRRTSTYWSTSVSGDEWVEIDLRQSRPIQRVTLDQTGRVQYFPERYEVFVTDDPAQPGEPRATGQGQRTKTLIDLPGETRGRYVIIKNVTERKDSGWSITELYVD